MKKFDALDELLAFYKKYIPQTVYLMKNPNRYPEVEKAVKEISDFALAIDSTAKVKSKPDDLTGSSLCLEITTDLIVVDEIDKFCSALSKADTFEASPLTNGKIFFALTFEDTWIPAPACKGGLNK